MYYINVDNMNLIALARCEHMRFIAHRGNLTGPDSNENRPDHIDKAISLGYDVEIDVWVDECRIYLGHDKPQYKIDVDFLEKRRNSIWCHAKNIHALSFLLWNRFHVFFHDKDDYTLTSQGVVWAYPGTPLVEGCVCVMPEMADDPMYLQTNAHLVSGVCTDYVQLYKSMFTKNVRIKDERIEDERIEDERIEDKRA